MTKGIKEERVYFDLTVAEGESIILGRHAMVGELETETITHRKQRKWAKAINFKTGFQGYTSFSKVLPPKHLINSKEHHQLGAKC